MQAGHEQVHHDPGAHRFSARVDGHDAYVKYAQIGSGQIALTHTVVPDEIGGRGIAGTLVKAALDFARAEGLKVVPQCSYAAAYLDKHPAYSDLRVR